MLVGPEAHVSDEGGIKLDISQYICIGLLILTAILLAAYILFIRCRYFRSQKCASCGQTVPISGEEWVEGFWQRVYHEGCWKAVKGEDRQVKKTARVGRGRRAIADGEGRDAEKGGAEGVSLIHPKKIAGSRSSSGFSAAGQTAVKDTVHTPTVSSPLTTSMPTLPYSDPVAPSDTPNASIAQPTLEPYNTPYEAPSTSSPGTRPKGTPLVPSSLPILQPQRKPPPRQASLYIRQVQTYTPTTTKLPPRSTSMYANSYSTLSQYDDSQKFPGGRMLHAVQEEEVPAMGRYKARQSVDVGYAQAGRGEQGLEVEIVPLDRDDSSYRGAL